MKKRLISWILCVCLLVSCCGMSAGAVVTAAEEANTYIIHTFSVRFAENIVLGSTGGAIATKGEMFEAIDLTEYGYTTDPSRLAIQVDTYAEGDDLFWSFMSAKALQGQMELTSSGGCDFEENGINPGKAFAFERGAWKRVIIPLSLFTDRNGNGELDPTKFNYFRVYLEDTCAPAFAGGTGVVKLYNFTLVDTAAEAPSEDDFPIGDGSFVPAPPVFKKMDVTPGYNKGETVFAGYNLNEYLEEHPEISVLNAKGEEDYAPVVNSLLSGLASVGGGALFIPAGEYAFRRDIYVPDGTSIIGEWISPDENPEARGTIIKVYCGKGDVNGAFISMGAHTMVQNLSFWYPEQTVKEFAAYPPTIDLNQYTFAKNITLYNSYFGIRSLTTANCPNAWNIYGTPLNIGLDFDMVIDIARIEEIHFSPDYWIESELEGAPTSAADIKALEEQLYNYAIAITLRRIDWSYVTYSDIEGYNTALMFAQSVDGNWPNGQCVGLTFTDCKYGHFAYGVANTTESLLDITMENCEYGVYITNTSEGMVYDGTIRYFDADIEATKYAVYQDSSMQQFNMIASTVRNGRVYTKNGSNVFINNEFQNAAPHIELDYGTVAGVVIGNTDVYGDPIVCENYGRCTYTYKETPVAIDDYNALTREEAAARVVGPASTYYRIPTDLDTSGATDMTEKIQNYLTELGQNGGGTLFLQPGKYRVDGTLTVPTGVELRGAADYATVPKAVNTILQVYTPIEAGKDEYTSAATVTLSENSGLRGVIFNYPEQNQTYHEGEKVLDPIVSAETGVDTYVQYYEFDFLPYPYTIRGTGADVYLVNVTVRNGWNGVDFMTYRCDNHYIDYLAGHFYNRGMVVGNGAVGGYIRNYQFNYNSIMVNAGTWSGWGGIPNSEITTADFHQPMVAVFKNKAITLQLGHVEDQLVYNCFNYGCYIGVHLIAEDSGAADVRIFGHGVDGGTVSVQIEAAKHVEFTNLQLTSFNLYGDNRNTDRWAVDESKVPLYDIWVKDTFEGEFSIYNFAEWAHKTYASVRVDSGTVNIHNAQINDGEEMPLFELNGDGSANVVALTTQMKYNPVVAIGELANLRIIGGFYYSEMQNTDKLGAFEGMHLYARKQENAVPKNVIFTEDSEIVFAQSFDSYDLSEDPTFAVSDTKYGTVRRGTIRSRLVESEYSQSIMLGYDKYAEKVPFALESGKKNDLYRIEWRIIVDKMRDSEDSEICMYLTNAKINMSILFTVKRDGSVYDQIGNKIGTIKFGEYYRFAIEVDARNASNKTATVYLLSDGSRVIGKGDTTALADIFQGENTVTGFHLSSIAFPYEGTAGTETDLSLDYFYVCRSEQSSIGRNIDPDSVMIGDVDNSGKVDSTDARLVLQYAVKKIASLPALDAADVDGNGKTDSTDARLILQYAVKKITQFPAA